MRRALIITLLLAVVPAADAMACSVLLQTPRQRVQGAKIAVYVSVLSVRELGRARTGGIVWEARVRRVRTFKGRPPRVFRVGSDSDAGSCGLSPLAVGQRVGLLLYERRPPYGLTVGSTMSLAELRRGSRAP